MTPKEGGGWFGLPGRVSWGVRFGGPDFVDEIGTYPSFSSFLLSVVVRWGKGGRRNLRTIEKNESDQTPRLPVDLHLGLKE